MLKGSERFRNYLGLAMIVCVFALGALYPTGARAFTGFIENQGQVDPEVVYYGPTSFGTVYVTAQAIVFDLKGQDQEENCAVYFNFNANSKALRIAPGDPLTTTFNYFSGDDSSNWLSRVPAYRELNLSLPGGEGEIRLGLDETGLSLMAGSGRAQDIDLAQLVVVGADNTAQQGEILLVQAAGREIEFTPPSSDDRQGWLRIRDLDPDMADKGINDAPEKLLWSTFIGGTSDDKARGLAVDSSGRPVVVGQTFSSNFPSTPGSYDPSYSGEDWDAFVCKLSADGSAMVWATYVGHHQGNLAAYQFAFAVVLDPDDNVVVGLGDNGNGGLPTTEGAYDRGHNGYDEIGIIKLSADGSTLMWGTYLGGGRWDKVGEQGLALDEDQNVLVAGETASGAAPFPTTAGAFDESQNGGTYDGFVCKLSADGSTLMFSTFLGGAGNDKIRGLSTDDEGNIYVAGHTSSTDLPGTAGTFDETHNGYTDGFLSKLSPDGSTLAWSTFLGSPNSQADVANDVAVDSEGNPVVVGGGWSGFPSTPGSFDSSHNGSVDGFVTKLTPDGTTMIWGTFIGGGHEDPVYSLVLDPQDCPVISGKTGGSGFPTTLDAYDRGYNGFSEDAYISRLSADGSTLLYSSYAGGDLGDWGFAVALDQVGKAFLMGDTFSNTFPSTPGAFDTSRTGWDGFLLKMEVGVVALPGSHWTGAGDGTSWEDGANWSTGTMPGAGDDVYISLDGPYTVTISSSKTVQTLTLDAADGQPTLIIDGCDLQATAGIENECTIQLRTNAGLNIDSGAEIENQASGIIVLDDGSLGGDGEVNNLGVVEVSGAGTSTVSVTFNNNQDGGKAGGEVRIDSGRLNITGPCLNASTMSVAAGGVLIIAENLDVTEAGALDVSGEMQIEAAATLSVAGRFDVNGEGIAEVVGSGAVCEFVDGGLGFVNESPAVLNARDGGEIRTVGAGSLLEMNAGGRARAFYPGSRIRAMGGGTIVVTVGNGHIAAQSGGLVEADGDGSRVRAVGNGYILANGENSVVRAINQGTVEAEGPSSRVITNEGGLVLASGLNASIRATNGGWFFSQGMNSTFEVAAGSQLYIDGGASRMWIRDGAWVSVHGLGGGGQPSELLAENGATVTVESGCRMHLWDWGNAEIGSLSSLDNDGRITLSGQSTLANQGSFEHRRYGLVQGTGTVHLSGGNFINDGIWSPGFGVGALHFGDDFTLSPEGTVVFQIAGDVPTLEYDQLFVSGAADISGNLHVWLLAGYTPPLGTTFDLIVAGAKGGGGLKGVIDCYSGLKINDDLYLEPVVQPSGLSLVVVENTITNEDPVAVADWGETVEITPLILYPLGNDSDPDGDDISLVAISETTQGGSAWINDDGVSVTYLPDPGFVGEDVFSYFITDCNGGSDEGQVSMYVGGAEPAVLAFQPDASGPINCSQSATLSLHYTPNSVGRPLRGFSVTFGPSNELSFDAGDVVDSGVMAGLADIYVFEVVTNGDGTLTVDAALFGDTSGLVQEADLFTVFVHGEDSGDGEVSIPGYAMRDLDNLGFVADVQSATVVVDCVPPLAATSLAATPGNGQVLVAWQDPAATDLDGIEIWRGPWHDGSGNSLYPEYDDIVGNVIPTRPADRTAAFDSPEWTLAGEVAPGGGSFPDVSLDRGVYYYEVFARDVAGNYGPPATENNRATSYILGDIRTPYDGGVNAADVTDLGASYGLQDGEGGYNNEADVGPTDDWSGSGIPETDNWINFEDLMIFAVNFEAIPPMMACSIETGTAELTWNRADDDNWVLALVEPCPTLKGLRVKARLADGVKPVVTAGSLLENQVTSYFLRNIDGEGIDLGVALFGSGMGIEGVGELFSVRLPADVIPGDLEIEARDTANKELEINLEYEALSEIPSVYSLAQNYPNPFNPTTTIRFDLPERGKVRLEIYGCDGGRVASLVDSEFPAGFHEVIWDGRTDLGVQAASGVYFYQIQAGPLKQTRKMLLLK